MIIPWPISSIMLAASEVDNVGRILKSPEKTLPRLSKCHLLEFLSVCLRGLRGTLEPKISVSGLHILRLSDYSSKLSGAVEIAD